MSNQALILSSEALMTLVKENPDIAVRATRSAEERFYQRMIDGTIRKHFEKRLEHALREHPAGIGTVLNDAAKRQVREHAMSVFQEALAASIDTIADAVAKRLKVETPA